MLAYYYASFMLTSLFLTKLTSIPTNLTHHHIITSSQSFFSSLQTQLFPFFSSSKQQPPVPKHIYHLLIIQSLIICKKLLCQPTRPLAIKLCCDDYLPDCTAFRWTVQRNPFSFLNHFPSTRSDRRMIVEVESTRHFIFSSTSRKNI